MGNIRNASRPYSDLPNQPLEKWSGNCFFFIFQSLGAYYLFLILAALGLPCGAEAQLHVPDLNSLARIKLASTCITRRILNHWTREVPGKLLTPSPGGIFIHLSLRNTALKCSIGKTELDLQARDFQTSPCTFEKASEREVKAGRQTG